MSKRVIVLGTNHYNAIGVVQCAGYAHAHVILVMVGIEDSLIAKSKYINELYCVNSYSEAIAYISENLRSSQKTVIIPCGDEAALCVDRNRNLLEDSFYFQFSGVYSLEQLMNKNTQMQFASGCGIAVPLSYEINSIYDIPANVRMPVILKPLLSCEGDKRDICIIRKTQELQKKVKELLELTPRIVLQEYLENSECELNILGYRDQKGNCIIPCSIEKLRLHPVGRGSVSVANVSIINSNQRQLVQSIERLMAKMEYVGLFSVELMRCNKKYYLIEVNLRNDALNTFVFKYGINLIDCHVCDMLGIPYEANMVDSGVKKMICEPMHLTSVYRRSISVLTWLKDIFTCDAFMLDIKGDKQLFFRQFVDRILNKL